MRLIKEPLFHFALLGALLFGWFYWLNPDALEADDDRRIEIDVRDVERMVDQFQGSWNRPPTQKELVGLVDYLVRQEVLVREARAIGLEQGDGVIRNRLAQKMTFLTTSAAQAMQPDDEALQEFMAENSERFETPAQIAFEQVSLVPDAESDDIKVALDALNGGADPAGLGHNNLLPGLLPLSPAAVVNARFGRGFAEKLADLPTGEWVGPVQSSYGPHLVRVLERKEAALPPLPSVRDKVLLEWRSAKSADLSERQYEIMKAAFDISLPDLTTIEGVLKQ